MANGLPTKCRPIRGMWLFAVAALLAAAPAAAKELRSRFAFHLADIGGAIAMSWPGLTYDPAGRELFVNDRSAGAVRVFRESGMQVQSFGEDETLGTILDLAVGQNGDLFVLSIPDKQPVLWRCDFRGEPQEVVTLKGVPPSFAARFDPGAIRQANGRLYLADKARFRVLVVDEQGNTIAARDLLPSLSLDRKKRESALMTGFAVDAADDILFTIGPLFFACVVSPSGEVRAFGVRGSSPGKFNVVSGIAADEHGNVYVADLLRAVVMVFDPSLQFIGEFGYRGHAPGNLITPNDLAAWGGMVYVAEGANRGVSVFRVEIREDVQG